MQQRLFPDPLLTLVNNPKEIFLKIKYFESGLPKSLKKVNFVFFYRAQSNLMDSYLKQKGSGTSDQSLFGLQNKLF